MKKYRTFLILIVLFLIPLRNVNMGVDITDTGYNLGCYRWFGTGLGEGMWSVVFFIANGIGHIFTKLPGGSTWLGMNIYCSLVVSIMAVTAYLFFTGYPLMGGLKPETEATGKSPLPETEATGKSPLPETEATGKSPLHGTGAYGKKTVPENEPPGKKPLPEDEGDDRRPPMSYYMDAPAAGGVLLACFLCWCPQVILYNYLTYLVLLVGAILVLRGLRPDRWAKPCLFIAGVILGLSVGVRFSNLTQMALVFVLWYDRYKKRIPLTGVVKDTLICVAGYVLGITAVLTMVSLKYGFASFIDMVMALMTMSANVEGYSGKDMILSPYMDYLDALIPWGLLFIGTALVATAIMGLVKRDLIDENRFNPGRSFVTILSVFYAAILFILVRFCYGRGMFGSNFNEYFSMVRWVSLFNLAALVLNISALFDKRLSHNEKLLSLTALIMVLIIPLGSNNKSYPLINDLFFVAPVTLYHIQRLVFYPARNIKKQFGVLQNSFSKDIIRITVMVLMLMLFYQSAGFGNTFVFRDYAYAESRSTGVPGNSVLKGMLTRPSNAQSIYELCSYWDKEGLRGRGLILYGDIPGVSYILDEPSVISSTWSNLGSHHMDYWNRDFDIVVSNMDHQRPVVIIGAGYKETDPKRELLEQFLEDYDYELGFSNDRFLLYT